MKHYQHFINGQQTSPSNGEQIEVVDPSSGEVFASIARGNASDVQIAIVAAQNAFEGSWRKFTAAERGRLLQALGRAILAHQDELATLEMRDCGKPWKQANNDVIACARYFEFYGGAAPVFHGETIPYADGYSVLTWREPYGVTGHIIPWNYPMQIYGRSVAAALAVGNCSVVKPAEDACLSLLRITELAHELGFPAGVVNIVTGYGKEAGAALVQSPGTQHISFTGSAATGAWVSAAAAQRHCPVTMELGGKGPNVVFADADWERALPSLVNAIIQNAGQTCSAGSRVLVEKSLYPELVKALSQRFSALVAAAGQADRDLGPVIRASQQARIQEYLGLAPELIAAQGSIDASAPKGGFYIKPTLLKDVPITHRLAQEEIFGPVLCVSAFADENEAVKLANGTEFGLVAGVWTRDVGRAMRMAKAVQAGQVYVNNYGAAGGIELPFGGYKASGHGREKGFEGLYGFSQLKTVSIAHH
ncbi:MAG: hypothetical protein RLZZ502_1720 [Pseudomonadota bacterium]|jgi:aldehyde dehydrogenase (NAD+)